MTVVLFGEDARRRGGSIGGAVGEDADDVGAAADLLVQAFLSELFAPESAARCSFGKAVKASRSVPGLVQERGRPLGKLAHPTASTIRAC